MPVEGLLGPVRQLARRPPGDVVVATGHPWSGLRAFASAKITKEVSCENVHR